LRVIREELDDTGQASEPGVDAFFTLAVAALELGLGRSSRSAVIQFSRQDRVRWP
jgi:hypothetical protein